MPALHDPGGRKINVPAVRLEYVMKMYDGFIALLKVKTICVFGETPVAPRTGLLETVVAACAGTANSSAAAKHPRRIKAKRFRFITVVMTGSGS